MKKRRFDTRYMATLAMLCGVLIVMGMTGIGFIPLPVIKATTMHIPVLCWGPEPVRCWGRCLDFVPSGSIR